MSAYKIFVWGISIFTTFRECVRVFVCVHCASVCLFFNVILFSAVSYFYERGVQTISTQFNQQSTWWTRLWTWPWFTLFARPRPTVVRAHFHTVLQLQSQIDQGASVREWNWLRKNHAGKMGYPQHYYYFMCIRNGVLSVCACDWPDNLFKLNTLSLYITCTDLSHLRWWNAGEAAALPDWRDAKYVYHDQEVCWELGQSSCFSYARGHLSTAHR